MYGFVTQLFLWFQYEDRDYLGALEEHVPRDSPDQNHSPNLSPVLLALLRALPLRQRREGLQSKPQDPQSRNGRYGQQTGVERWSLGHPDHPPDYAGQSKLPVMSQRKIISSSTHI